MFILKPYVFAIFILGSRLVVSAQNPDARIAQIKQMFATATQNEKNIKNSNCKSGSKTTYDGLVKKEYPFKQSGKICKLPQGYAIYYGDFKGYDWMQKTTCYLKDGKLFFIYIERSAEACADEIRLYFDKNGKAIRALEKSNDCDPQKLPEGEKTLSKEDARPIITQAMKDYNDILKMVK